MVRGWGLLLSLGVTLGCGRLGYDPLALQPDPNATDANPSAPDASILCPTSLAEVDCESVACVDAALCKDLALLLHFDDESGKDSSGNANNAVCGSSCPSWISSGQFGGAYSFVEPEYLEVANHPTLDAQEQVTISAWFLANSFPADFAPIVSKWVPSPEQSNYRLAQNGQEFYVNYNNANGWQNHASGTTYQTDRWYHLVGQIDDTTDTIRLYVDEMLVMETTDTEEVELDEGKLFIGWATNELGIDGQIDEVAVWTRILSAGEIAQLY